MGRDGVCLVKAGTAGEEGSMLSLAGNRKALTLILTDSSQHQGVGGMRGLFQGRYLNTGKRSYTGHWRKQER